MKLEFGDERRGNSVQFHYRFGIRNFPSHAALLVVAPTAPEWMRDSDVIQNSCDDEVNDVAQSLRLMIKARHCRKHSGSGLSHRRHVAELDHAERCFPRHQQQRSSLFQMHVGRTVDEIDRGSGSDRG